MPQVEPNMLAAGLFDGFGHLSVQGAHLEQRRSSVWLVGACGEGSVVGAAMLVRLSHQFQDAARQDQWYTGNYVKAQGTAHRLMRVLLMILY